MSLGDPAFGPSFRALQEKLADMERRLAMEKATSANLRAENDRLARELKVARFQLDHVTEERDAARDIADYHTIYATRWRDHAYGNLGGVVMLRRRPWTEEDE